MAQQELKTEKQVVARFNEMRANVNGLATKINELKSDAHEHELVVQTLEPMDKSRKCFRLVGDVLVERTVGETLPAVQRNKAQLDATIEVLNQQLETKTKELSEFQAQYKIRVRSGDDEEQPGSSASTSSAQQGVLVSNQ